MKTICLGPVTSALLIAGHVSFVTVEYPPPWLGVGQRLAIYVAWERAKANGQKIVTDAIVGSGTIAEAPLPIVEGLGAPDDPLPRICNCTKDGRGLRLMRPFVYPSDDISDQLPLQDWTPGRWALRFTDVTATEFYRCGRCNGLGVIADHEGSALDCPACDGEAMIAPPVVAPVLSGDDPTRPQ